jgi:hypothetical protein
LRVCLVVAAVNFNHLEQGLEGCIFVIAVLLKGLAQPKVSIH